MEQETNTKQILKTIYQELKEEINKNENFVKKYTIPSINYNLNGKEIGDMYFASEIKMELERIMKFLENKVNFFSYKDKYFFSNSAKKAEAEMLIEMEKDKELLDNKNDKLKEKLIEKLENEFKEYIEKIKQKKPNEIVESSYEIVIKEQILSIMRDKDFEKEELKALLKNGSNLNDIYWEWIDSDANFNEILEYSVDEGIECIVQDYEREKREKRKER